MNNNSKSISSSFISFSLTSNGLETTWIYKIHGPKTVKRELHYQICLISVNFFSRCFKMM